MLKKFILIDLLDLCDLIKKTDTYLTLFYYVFSYAKFRPTYMYRVGLEQVSLVSKWTRGGFEKFWTGMEVYTC